MKVVENIRLYIKHDSKKSASRRRLRIVLFLYCQRSVIHTHGDAHIVFRWFRCVKVLFFAVIFSYAIKIIKLNVTVFVPPQFLHVAIQKLFGATHTHTHIHATTEFFFSAPVVFLAQFKRALHNSSTFVYRYGVYR